VSQYLVRLNKRSIYSKISQYIHFSEVPLIT
jgi:hypothetical protein